MKDWKDEITANYIIAILLTLTFCYLTITEKIEARDFLTVFLMIIAYYFGQFSHANPKNKKEE